MKNSGTSVCVTGARTTNGLVTVTEQHLVHHVVLRRGGTAGQIAAFGKQRQIMQQQGGGSWKKIFGGGKSEHVFMSRSALLNRTHW